MYTLLDSFFNPELVAQIGVFGSLVLFFVWQSDKRERRMAASLEALNEFQKKDLMSINRASVEAQFRMADAIDKMASAVSQIPCKGFEDVHRSTGDSE